MLHSLVMKEKYSQNIKKLRNTVTRIADSEIELMDHGVSFETKKYILF